MTWWVAAAQMGLSLLNGYGQSKIQAAQAKAQKVLNEAQIEAENTVKTAANEYQSATNSVRNWARSVSNQRLIKAAGEQYNALSTNINRTLDQAVTGNFQRRLQASEQLGQLQARAAAAGVGGTSVDLINGTLRLRNAMLNEELEKQQGQATYDQLMMRAGVMDNAYDQWDYSQNLENRDYTRSLMPITVDTSEMSWKNVLLETAFGAAGNLFSGGTNAGPLSLLSKLGMGGQQAGQGIQGVSSLWGPSSSGAANASSTALANTSGMSGAWLKI